MNPTQSTKIVFAAKFKAQKYDIFLLQRIYKSDSKLLIKVNSSYSSYWESYKKPYLAYWGNINKKNGSEQIDELISSIKNIEKNKIPGSFSCTCSETQEVGAPICNIII